MEKISRTDHVRNEEVLHRVEWERNIIHKVIRRKVDWTGHILRMNRFQKHVTEGKMEGTGRRGKRRKSLLNDLKEATAYWEMREEALGCTVCSTHFRTSYGPVVRLYVYYRLCLLVSGSSQPDYLLQCGMWVDDGGSSIRAY
jgi:hypothetical protein